MFSVLFEYVTGASPELIETLGIEDIAICASWYDSLADTPDERKRYAALPDAVGHWMKHSKPPGVPDTEGTRRQPLLRTILQRLEISGIGALNRNELDILYAVRDITSRIESPGRFERIRQMIEKRCKLLDARRKALPQRPGLVDIEDMLHFVTAANIERARPRSVRSFAGVELPDRGPVYWHTGDVKVLDHVPDDCMLVVENGLCCVNGYVLGRVAATKDCDIQENIAGVVIVRDGDIHARNVINNAFVVSKWGSAYVRRAENPELFYAGVRIKIREDAIMGTYASPIIEVGGEIKGGEFSVSKKISARLFRQSESRRLNIGLRRKISCENYGQLLEPQASRLLASLTRLGQRRNNLNTMIGLTENECEHLARNAIVFLFGGEGIEKHIKEKSAAQKRLAFLDRLLAGIDALSFTTEEKISREEASHAGEDLVHNEIEDFTFDDVERELQHVETDEEADSPLAGERGELLHVAKALAQGPSTKSILPTMLVRLREKKGNWAREREAVIREIEEREIALQRAVGSTKILEKGYEESNKVEVLHKLIAEARGRPSSDSLFRRSRTNFVQLMLRSIDKRRQRQGTHGDALRHVENAIQDTSKKLREQYYISPPALAGDPESAPRAEGRFEFGVKLCTDPCLLTEEFAPAGSVISTRDSDSAVKSYVRQGDIIAEEED